MTLERIAINAANELTRRMHVETFPNGLDSIFQRRARIVSRWDLIYVPDYSRFFPEDETCEIRGRHYLVEDVYTCECCSGFATQTRTVLGVSYRGRQTESEWCGQCVSDSAYYCEGCGEYFEENRMEFSDDGHYCLACFEGNNSLPSYHSAKRWNPANTALPSYSIELEIEAGERADLIRSLKASAFPRVSWERDGSLDCEKGLEILIQHRESLFSLASDTCSLVASIKGKGFDVVSANSKACGLHLNANRDSRWNKHRLMRLLYIVRKLKYLFVKVSNRESQNWADYEAHGMTLADEAKGSGGKYRALRIGPDRFEWRMFKGTLKESRIRLYCATVQKMEDLACSDVSAHHLKRVAELTLQSLLSLFHSNQI